jgi:hypothetical protein
VSLQESAPPPGLTVGYDPLFSSDITYEEQRLRAGSFHTDQQRHRANSLMMDTGIGIGVGVGVGVGMGIGMGGQQRGDTWQVCAVGYCEL